MEWTQASVTVGDGGLTYSRSPPAGGEPIVLLHPWFGCTRFWDETVAGLPGRHFLVPDLYSAGDREWTEFVGPEGLAKLVIAMLDAEGIERCFLAGNSMGGITAQVVAAAQPSRVSKLVLVGTGASTSVLHPDYRRAIDEWLEADPDGSRSAAFVRRLLARDPAPERMKQYVDAVLNANRAFIAATLSTALRLDLRPRLPKITAQTLVIRGALDAGRTPEDVRHLVEGIPDSTAREIPDAGHSPMVDSPDAFLALVRPFFA